MNNAERMRAELSAQMLLRSAGNSFLKYCEMED